MYFSYCIEAWSASQGAFYCRHHDMLAEASASSAEMLTIIVSNSFGAPSRFHVTLPSDATIQELMQKVAEESKFVPGTFALLRGENTHRLTDADVDTQQLANAGICNKCRLSILGVNDGTPLCVDADESSSAAAAALGTVALWSQSRGEGGGMFHGPLNRGVHGGHSSSNEPNASGFVGLVNQGATCYLSSLLQSLFMTPEFRRALYDATDAAPKPARAQDKENCRSTETDQTAASSDSSGGGSGRSAGGGLSVLVRRGDGSGSGEGGTGILRQLQRLFVSLQTSNAQAIDTKELTKSFGWSSGDSFIQHDVQELLRVLFDALETELECTSQAGALSRIYRGEWTDYVQCKHCFHQSLNPSHFDDINLAIRAFDEQQTQFGSLEEALTAFLQPETLEGDNAYFCEACACKQPALKGTRFLSLPPILCVGLKRFDFDLQTLSRVKLHHAVRIPSTLDVAPFVDGGSVARQHSQTKRTIVGAASPETESPSGPGGGAKLPPMAPLPPSAIGVDGSDVRMTVAMPEGQGKETIRVAAAEKAESAGSLYELFSLLMHSGSALAGHYFAYIKELRSGEWYLFNDSRVTKATPEQLKAARGEGDGAPGATCYMCLFRRMAGSAKGGEEDDAGAEDGEGGVPQQSHGLQVEVPDALKELLLRPEASAGSKSSTSNPAQPQESGTADDAVDHSAGTTAPTQSTGGVKRVAPGSEVDRSTDQQTPGVAASAVNQAFQIMKSRGGSVPTMMPLSKDTACADGGAGPRTSEDDADLQAAIIASLGGGGRGGSGGATGSSIESMVVDTAWETAPPPCEMSDG